MEVSVEVSGELSALAEPAANAPSTNQEAEGAKSELAKIMSDPTHPHYAGFKRIPMDPKTDAHVSAVYRRAYPDAAPTPVQIVPAELSEAQRDAARPHEQDPSLSPEDRVAHSEVDTMYRQTFGDAYDTAMADMRIGARHLFATPEGQKMLDALSPIISDLGPLAEVRGVRFLAEIGQLIKQQQGGRT